VKPAGNASPRYHRVHVHCRHDEANRLLNCLSPCPGTVTHVHVQSNHFERDIHLCTEHVGDCPDCVPLGDYARLPRPGPMRVLAMRQRRKRDGRFTSCIT